jgi:hypothetical protein
MKKTQIVVRKKVKGRVEYNDGEFAEIQIWPPKTSSRLTPI